jgi:hypothetical protein
VGQLVVGWGRQLEELVMLMTMLLMEELQLQAEVAPAASYAGSDSQRMKAEVHLEHQRDSFSFERFRT